MNAIYANPAIAAAEKSLAEVYKCLDQNKSFRLEAGAGSGKTHSLVKALGYLIEKQGSELIRRHQQVACITFTNVASDEINARTDGHPAVLSSTIHAFCWSLIKDFQPFLRDTLFTLPKWEDRITEGGGIAGRAIDYELGYPSAKMEDKEISLHHNDVLSLTVKLMEQAKFRRLFIARYPILFIDEYQDTNTDFVAALKSHFLDTEEHPLIGIFGDHWQKIYEDGCGKIEHAKLVPIEQHSNFRSVSSVVEVLNRMRPELPQSVVDPKSKGFVAAFHTNGWVGTRLTGYNKDDLPADVAHEHLDALRAKLTEQGWDFSPAKSKILMLTHNVLAHEQGYGGIAKVFKGKNDAFVKKEDRHIKFFVETLELVCIAYQNGRFGEMFAALGGGTPTIHSHFEKLNWVADMNTLLNLRSTGTIGAVLDHLRVLKRPRLPEALEKKEHDFEHFVMVEGTEEPSWIDRLRELRTVPYQEVVSLAEFIDDKTPFSTKHGVKGAEFENVLVVAGRGWANYNFNQLLEWSVAPNVVPVDKTDSFERNRNLLYVACSRPKKRLAILFTQKLSHTALGTLSKWFGDNNVHPFKST